MSARRRGSALVEGESLLNDAAAITLFVLLLENDGRGPSDSRRRGVVVVRSEISSAASRQVTWRPADCRSAARGSATCGWRR